MQSDCLLFLQVDSPKDAQAAEAKGQHFDGGAPGQDEQSETDVDQKEKPKQQKDSNSDEGKPVGGGYISTPKDLGEARKPGTSVRSLSTTLSFSCSRDFTRRAPRAVRLLASGSTDATFIVARAIIARGLDILPVSYSLTIQFFYPIACSCRSPTLGGWIT
jgi:hypothetical protein